MTTASHDHLNVAMDGRFLQDKWHGVGRYAYGLLTGLCAIPGSHRIVLFIDRSLPNERFPIDQLVESGRVELRPFSTAMYNPAELWAWPSALRYTPTVDVFHSPYFWPPLTLACPLVTTVHDMIFDRYPHYIPGRRFLIPYKIMSRLSLWRSRLVIAVSEATKRDIVRYAHIKPEKIITVLEGVEASFTPVRQSEELARVKQKYDLPSSYILALGARRPHKNIKRLVAAFSMLAPTIPQSLVLSGTIDERFSDDVSDTIADLKARGRIREVGHIAEEDLRAIYSSADLFVQPSIIEGFGLPVLEAMACGCAVACSNTSSLPEVGGDAVALFDPLSERDIAHTMQQLVESPTMRHSLAERGMQRAQQFSWNVAAQKTLDVFHAARSSPK